MKFKNVKTLSLLLAAAVMSLTSCNEQLEKVDEGKKPEFAGQPLHISAAIALPSTPGTRSATDNEGETNSNATPDDFEYGYEYENDVRTMILVFAGPNDEYITHSVISDIIQAPAANQNFNFVVNGEIKYADLEAAYTTPSGQQAALIGKDHNTVNVYAFCNYTGKMLEKFENIKEAEKAGAWVNWSGEVEEGASPAGHTPAISNTIWANRSFLMSSAETHTVKFPEALEDWDPFASKDNPFEVAGPNKAIKVERAAARIDFRDGSDAIWGAAANEKNANTYPIESISADNIDPENSDNSEPPTKISLFNVKLTRMALVNMSRNFYYLRRVSDDGLGDNVTIVGAEKLIPKEKEGSATQLVSNYVVDTDWALKSVEKGINPKNAAAHFNFPLYKKDETGNYYDYDTKAWYVDDISTVLNGKKDNWGNKDYKIWRYVTENTIPGIEQQKTVQSVGVVFKAAILPGEDIDATYTDDGVKRPYLTEKTREALKKAAREDHNENTDEYPVLYSFNNRLYAGIDEIVRAAKIDGENGPLNLAVTSILDKFKEDEKWEESRYITYEGVAEPEALELTVVNYCDILDAKQKLAENEDAAENMTSREKALADVILPDFSGTITTADGEKMEKEEGAFMLAAPQGNITVYMATNENDGHGWGYFCYYFYWNRHNDNGLSGKMGPMEFATVRNNVYKLSVTKIGQLGHPRIPGLDPDPVEPEDPDEEELRYFQVQIEVLPWVVRVNGIEF